MLGNNSSISQRTEKYIFRTTGSFFKCPHRYMDRCRTTNNLIVGGFKNSCRFTDVNTNYLRAKNLEFYILNSIVFLRPKNWNKPVRGSELTNPDLIGTWNRVATPSHMKCIFTAGCLYEIHLNYPPPEAPHIR